MGFCKAATSGRAGDGRPIKPRPVVAPETEYGGNEALGRAEKSVSQFCYSNPKREIRNKFQARM